MPEDARARRPTRSSYRLKMIPARIGPSTPWVRTYLDWLVSVPWSVFHQRQS